MSMTGNNWRIFPRWMMEEHEIDIHFIALLSTGRAAEVTERVQREPATMQVLLALLGDERTALSVRIGIGVVMEDLAGSNLLQQQVDMLGKLSQHKDHRVRADACHYLGLTYDAGALPFLQNALQDPDAEVREVAEEALEIAQG
ncbi:HEAT repeat domain-containing protein [Candidatus Thiothrix sp. Deng01]|uniref:HEAT repeat domain-containing protein n=1 Tax=Candidatus Thiothrix phosphatis TaxID=3112415 RepID=A0ABU6D1J5_9GAMM|nr:HEAT repeat domain-containing protein [Candidatus Thiothrix sp. Deng01]MEB4592934.1 HEAT repeat domain-containing protein [Candidatus Thiothrix sp. Deng01]